MGVALDARGNVTADANKMTSVPGVFTAGDMTRGQSLVVWAIHEGRSAAQGVHNYLTKKVISKKRGEIMKKTVFILIALFVWPAVKARSQQQHEMDQRKDIGHKLILKSFADLQNKDLKSTIMTLKHPLRSILRSRKRICF